MVVLHIYLVRHGETDENRQGIVQGQLESNLNATGREQSRRMAQTLKVVQFVHAFVSNLGRAVESAAAVMKVHPTLQWTVHPGLRERYLGELQGKKRTSAENPPSVEPLEQYVQRILQWWDRDLFGCEIVQQQFECDRDEIRNILVIGHGSYLSNLVKALGSQKGYDVGLAGKAKAYNAGITVMEVNDRHALWGKMVQYLDIRHLDGMKEDVVKVNVDDVDKKADRIQSRISNNVTASGTARFGATIDVEQNTVRFLGSLVLNLWDCGGQESFLDSYLTTQKSTIFQHVGVLIYVFDVESRDTEKDLVYYRDCLEACGKFSPEAAVFLLVHKMDLVGGKKEKAEVFARKKKELLANSGTTKVKIFGTTIWDESLYKAWSRIVHTLIPNAPLLSKHLTTFARICSASEVVLFERTTFLIIARSGDQSMAEFDSDSDDSLDGSRNTDGESDVALNPKRFEKISELIKAFKISCSKLQEQFNSLEIRFPHYTAVLEILTSNTYVMIIVADPDVQSAALRMNIRLAREKFEELQAGSVYAASS
ncbi:GTP-binding protein gtr1 [Tulasnella sp. UAMH 9824]|nr:GTP-binding protein gtr1 [Tulasnella sp. UAMH 9824]